MQTILFHVPLLRLQEVRGSPGQKTDVATELRYEQLPAEVWVVSEGFNSKKFKAGADELNRSVLQKKLRESKPNDFTPFKTQDEPELVEIGGKVSKWADAGKVELGTLDIKRSSSLGEIIDSMRHFQREQVRRSQQEAGQTPADGSARAPAPLRPKLAMVLSGGGAKCAYQAGAIHSIEGEISRLQKLKPMGLLPGRATMVEPDIELVVGTSGGALNAVPVALGITRQAARDPKSSGIAATDSPLAAVWLSIYLTDFLSPHWVVLAGMGLCLGLVLLFATWITGKVCAKYVVWRERPISSGSSCEPEELSRNVMLALRVVLISLLGMFVLLRLWDADPDKNSYPSKNLIIDWPPYFRWFWLPFYLSSPGALIALVVGTWYTRSSEWRNFFERRPPFFKMVVCVVVLAVALACTTSLVFKWDKSFSANDSMRAVIISRFQRLLGIKSRGGDSSNQMETLSNRFVEEYRDRALIASVTLLGRDGAADRYLHIPANAPDANDVPKTLDGGARGSENHAFNDPNNLFKMIIASGTIFPIFSAEPFNDPQDKSPELLVVDGGYAHNIPVEAAVRWGATHIIVIEATASLDRSQKATFWNNLETAYDLLFAQAQVTDMRSREGVEIYTLRPQEEILKTLDFAPVFTRAAITKGAEDAAQGKFRQYSRTPRFER